MKRSTKKLAFTKQTVRVLHDAELQAANGGTIILQTRLNCPVLSTNCTNTSFCVPPTITAKQTGCDSTTSYHIGCTA